MKYIEHSDLDIERWNALVDSQQAEIFSYSWYLDACIDHWAVLVDQSFENGIAFGYVTKLGQRIITPPIFVRNLDFMGSDEVFRKKAMEYLMTHFQFGHLQSVQRWNFRKVKTRVFQQIENEFELGSQSKRMIQKATKQGIEIAPTEDWKLVLEIIREELSAKISEFTSENISRLHNLVSNLALNDRLICWGIFNNGNLEGGMFFMETDSKRMYLKGAARPHVRDAGGMYLCMQQAIQETIQLQKTFDFGGSEVEGVRRFNQNLGGIDHPYFLYDWDKTPFWFRWTKQIYQQWRKK